MAVSQGVIGQYVTCLCGVVEPLLYLGCLQMSHSEKLDRPAVYAMHPAGQTSTSVSCKSTAALASLYCLYGER